MRSSSLVLIVVAVIALILAFTCVSQGGSDDEEGDASFVILHSNDIHCSFSDGLGISTLKALKDSKVAAGETVFMVDAGDFLQGTSYGAVTQGRSAVEVMNAVGYDVGVPGNHEFDYSLSLLLERTPELNYSIICSNLTYADGVSVFPEYLVLEKGGVKIGFFGLLTQKTMTSVKTGYMGGAVITDPVEAAARMVPLLRGMGVDMVVAIGHLGVEHGTMTSDEVCGKVPGIDLFIDGHSHTMMEHGEALDGTELIQSGTVIASAGSYCEAFGVVTVTRDGIDAALYRGEPLYDADVAEAMERVDEEVSWILGAEVASTEVRLNGDRIDIRTGETNLGDLIADAFRWYGGTDLALVNAGGIRSSVEAGEVTFDDVYSVLPYFNSLVKLRVEGRSLYEALERAYVNLDTLGGGLLQMSGMTVTYDPGAEPGSRVVSICVDGKEVEADSVFTFCTTDYVSTGGDRNPAFAGYESEPVGDEAVALAEYLGCLGTVTAASIEMGRQTPI
ncbi:MAG: bifunctional metallophosphatase/5'-nucleotidase [Candidatus Methanomethylophilaceae archaeon]|nr:bifunctional metallophosphatase/5'-nucleotidase [Candidatus Methanomethylophilaceae archaeon]